MVGLFKSKYGYSELVDELRAWELRSHLINAFMAEFSGIACGHLKGWHRAWNVNYLDIRYTTLQEDLVRRALVDAAYDGWKKYLSTHKVTDKRVELATWAIMANRSDLLDGERKALAETAEQRFPSLINDAFDE